MSVKPKAFKELYGKAAGRCAMCPNYESVFPDTVCDIQITNKNMSEAAHVIAQSKKGPRGEEGYAGNIDDYDNLILLCPTHHKAVDDNPGSFPSNWLRSKKNQLEQWVNLSLKPDTRRSRDVSSLRSLIRYIPLTRIRGQCEDLPDSFNSNFLDIGSMLEAFPIDLPEARPFFDGVLESKFSGFEQSYHALAWILMSRFEVKEGHSFSIYKEAMQRGHHYIIPLNKGELYAHRESVALQADISRLKNSFIACYLALIEYLRFYYTEVDLDS